MGLVRSSMILHLMGLVVYLLQLKNSVSGGGVMGKFNIGFVPSVKHLVSSRFQMVYIYNYGISYSGHIHDQVQHCRRNVCSN